MNERKIAFIFMILALLGLGICVYLTNIHQEIMSGSLKEASLCSFGRLFNCDAVSASVYSSWWGIPVAWLGLLLYLFWFFLALNLFLHAKKHAATVIPLIMLTAACAVLLDLYFAWVMLTIIETICLFCVLTYVINIVFLGLSFFLYRKRQDKILPAMLVMLPFSSRASYGFISTAVMLLAIGVVGAYELQQAEDSQQNRFDVKAFQHYQATAKRVAIDTSSDPFRGSTEPLLTIVEFSDFECPMCRQAHVVLQTVLPAYQDKVKFVFKNMPLGIACNTLLRAQSGGREFHASACALAQLGEAAHAQHLFWDMHDVIFEQQDTWKDEAVTEEKLWLLAEKADMNLAQLKQDFMQQKEAVRQDIKVADHIGVRGTPSFFFNGLAVNGLVSPRTLQRIIELEIARAEEQKVQAIK